MVTYIIHAYVPVYFNDGQRVPLLTLVDTRVPILERWGGLTILENAQGMATGYAPETVDVYECVCEAEDARTVKGWWRAWAWWVRPILKQDSVRLAIWPCESIVESKDASELTTGERMMLDA